MQHHHNPLFDVRRHFRPSQSGRYIVSSHAQRRMTRRRISLKAVEAVLTYGRVAFVRQAKIFAIGRKEVARFGSDGIDLREFNGLQVVCTPSGDVLTVYRNHDFRPLRH